MTSGEPTTPGVDPEPSPESAGDPAAEAPRSNGEADESVSRALTAIVAQVQEIREQLERLLGIQLDRARLKLKTGVARAISLLTLTLVAVTAIVSAVLYLLAGLAGGLTAVFEGREWAGNLAAGALVLVFVWIVMAAVARRRRKDEMDRLVSKYETGRQRR